MYGIHTCKYVPGSTSVTKEIEISHPKENDASELCENVLDDVCGPCNVSRRRLVKPEWFCNDCDECLCIQCGSFHKGLKITSSHILITYQEKVSASQQVSCGPCKETKNGKIVASVWYCRECDEFLCDSCRVYHSGLKITRMHTLITKEERCAEVTKTSNKRQITTKKMTQSAKKSKMVTNQESNAMPVSPYMKRSASNIKKYCVKLPEDKKTPQTTGLGFISTSRFIITDGINERLKLFQLHSTGISIVAKKSFFKATPCGVGVHSENELAVAFTTSWSIGRFSVANNNIEDKCSISVGFSCSDLRYINRDTLAVVGISPPTVCVLDIAKGTQLWRLDGPYMVSEPDAIELDTAKTKAYVSYTKRNVVETIDLTGSRKVISTIQLADDAMPTGLGTDPENNVYVCTNGNDTIQQISPNGHVRTLLRKRDRVIHPSTISISPDGITFIIGCFGKDIVVFSME